MKKTTLAEAATQVVLGLPQEDLHEAINSDHKRVISYLNRFLKNSDINPEEAKEMYALCEKSIRSIPLKNLAWQHMFDLQRLTWSILFDGVEAILEDGANASTKRKVKNSLAAIKLAAKLESYYT